MSKVEKDNVLKRFYSYVPNNTVLINNGYILDESTENLKELSAQKNVNVQTNTLTHLEGEQPQKNVEQEQQLPNMERHPKLPFKQSNQTNRRRCYYESCILRFKNEDSQEHIR